MLGILDDSLLDYNGSSTQHFINSYDLHVKPTYISKIAVSIYACMPTYPYLYNMVSPSKNSAHSKIPKINKQWV